VVQLAQMALPYGRTFNFSAGPAALPLPVLEECKEELLNYRGNGMSVMEMSHRAAPFEKILAEAESDLRSLLGIPSDYKILFLQGGASLQFSMIPMNLLKSGSVAQFVVTGTWGKKAIDGAALLGEAKAIYDGAAGGYRNVPNLIELGIDPEAAYLHITNNETIQGVEFQSDPVVSPPLIADMSSDILSRPVAVDRYGLIYAGAQKNMGPAGLTIVIIKERLLEQSGCKLSPMLDYKIHAKNGSMYNTPPAWCIYVTGLVYKHLLKTGGLAAAQSNREEKASILYKAIDESEGFFSGHASVACRSRMNVTFTLSDNSLTEKFVAEAEAKSLEGLTGHRSVGGCRASIYNAFPVEGCQRLAEHMAEFANSNR
jgi:phosphoserine aminotransferase